jgi:hypothetical protein
MTYNLYLPDTPEHDGTIITTTTEQRLMKRVPRPANHTLFVTFKCLDLFFEVPHIKNFEEMVTRCCEEPVTVLVPLNIKTSILMSMAGMKGDKFS